MADKASIVAFVLSLLGATYQMLSYGLAFLVDNLYNYNYYFGIYGFFGVIATLVVFWAMSHLLDTRGYRNFTWPSIIVAIGAANLGNLIIQLATPTNIGPLLSSTVPIDVILINSCAYTTHNRRPAWLRSRSKPAPAIAQVSARADPQNSSITVN